MNTVTSQNIKQYKCKINTATKEVGTNKEMERNKKLQQKIHKGKYKKKHKTNTKTNEVYSNKHQVKENKLHKTNRT